MSGVILEEGRLLTQFGEEEGIIDKTIHFIKKDRFNRLWCGGENGISEIVHNDSGIIFNNFRPQLKPAIIPIFIDLICLDSGHCYAISRNAIYEVLDDQLVKISFEKIRELPVISKVIDKGSDQLMIATLGSGILQVSVDQNNTWKVDEVYDQSSGLISNNILNIHLDKESRLWSISQNGTCVIDNNAVRCYDKNDGWLPLETTHVDVQESEDGNLWVVANSSISVFPLYNLRENRHLPKVHITNISLFKDTSTVASYVTDIEKGHELILPHDQNFIEFKFVSTSLSKNGKNKFIYKLDGLDEDWNSPSKKTFVQYAGLKPGAYTFRVKAINNSGLEGTDEAAYSFTIKWPWYSTWWAIFIYFLLFVISLYYLLQLINSRKEKVLEAERLRSRNDFQSNFYTNVSHEFRTPLTVIMGVTEQIREELKKNSLSLDQELKMINRNATSLLSLVNQILNLSKLKHSKVQLLFINVNIIGFISQVIESVRPFAKSQNKEILFYSEEDELFMDIDEMTTTTLLINLISKAIKNTDQDQNIIVHVKVEEENQSFLSIKIRNGDLRNPHPRSSVKVHQSGISTDKEKGTEEIEIALAQQVVEILGGKFKFSNENDEVLEYLVLLPIKDQIKSKKNPSYTLSDAHLSSKKRIEVVPKDHVQGRKSILLVEDNQDVAQYIVEFLEKIYNVGYAQDGAKAMQLIKVSPPDLVVCDIMMPVMNGYEVCQAIRASEKTRNIPIIILTAKADINSRILGMAKGADAYLTKPFSQAELLAKIERLITKSSTAPQMKSDENFLSVLDIKNNDPGHQFIAKAASFILDNIENEVYGPVFLSRDMEISESSLYKKLKSLSGKSTAVFMRSIRLAKAREILLKTDVSITKVASTTGFKNASWFSRAFKKEFGYPPSDLRKEEI